MMDSTNTLSQGHISEQKNRKSLSNLKGYIEQKGKRTYRLVNLETDTPLTGWHTTRLACYNEFKKKRKKDGNRSN